MTMTSGTGTSLSATQSPAVADVLRIVADEWDSVTGAGVAGSATAGSGGTGGGPSFSARLRARAASLAAKAADETFCPHGTRDATTCHDCAASGYLAELARPLSTPAVSPAPAVGSLFKHHGQCASCGEEIGEQYVRNVDYKTGAEWHVGCARPVPDLAGTSRPNEPERPCTCHPDDNPPVPCPKKYALSECRTAAAPEAVSAKEDAAWIECRCGWSGWRVQLNYDSRTWSFHCPKCCKQHGSLDTPEASGTAREAPSQSSDTVSASPSPLATPEGAGRADKVVRQTPCCGMTWAIDEAEPRGPIFWNEFNKAVQCHNCGQAFDARSPLRSETPGEFDISSIPMATLLAASQANCADENKRRLAAESELAILRATRPVEAMKEGEAGLLRVVLESLSAELQRWYLSDQAEPRRTERLSIATAILFKRAGMEDFDGNFGFDWESDEVRKAALTRLQSTGRTG